MAEINATVLLEDLRTAMQKADDILESEKADSVKYAEALADLLERADILDSWLTDTEGKQLPQQWTNPQFPPTLDSPF